MSLTCCCLSDDGRCWCCRVNSTCVYRSLTSSGPTLAAGSQTATTLFTSVDVTADQFSFTGTSFDFVDNYTTSRAILSHFSMSAASNYDVLTIRFLLAHYYTVFPLGRIKRLHPSVCRPSVYYSAFDFLEIGKS